MLITILVMLSNVSNIEDVILSIGEKIKRIQYKKTLYEVIFVWTCQDKDGYKKVTDEPLIRLFYSDSYSDGLNTGLRKANGSVVIVTDNNCAINPDDLNVVANNFYIDPDDAKANKIVGMVIKPGFFVVKRSAERFPGDLSCAKTFAICQTMLAGEGIVGEWGDLNRKEIMRASYRVRSLKLNVQLKFLHAYIWGNEDSNGPGYLNKV